MPQSSNSVVEPSDILLEVVQDGETTALNVCARSIGINISWIKLRDERWFCGWLWGLQSTPSTLTLQSSSTVAVSTASKPVTVSELGCNVSNQRLFHI
jgi:hypothetical protein